MLDTVTPLFPGIPGGPELIIVLFVLVLLFGANKIPELARSTGQAIGEFQKGRQQIEDEIEDVKEDVQQPPGTTDESTRGAEVESSETTDTGE